MNKRVSRAFGALIILVLFLSACAPATPTQAPAAAQVEATQAPPAAEGSSINIIHYYSGELGKKTIDDIIDKYNASQDTYQFVDNTTGHEDFKTQILVMLAGDNPPNIFSYWSGARTQFIVDSDRLMPLDDFWTANDLDTVIPASLKPISTYGGKIYNIPQNAHIVGFFYNPKVLAEAGVTEPPKTWDEFIAMADKIKAAGVAPFALGSKNLWPAQYWFDYSVSRTAGPDYRQKLMAGEAAYTDPEVATAMELWKSLVDSDYFVENANAYDWTDAADQVAKGEAAMTLMGTWITGYWDGNGLKAGEDYAFFPFPIVDADIPEVVHGSIDGWVVPADSKAPEAAKELIAWMLKPENQAEWAKGQGALAATTTVDASIYNSVMKECSDYMGQVAFLSGYDLSTTPPMADGGLNMFGQFMNDASKYMDYLAQVEEVAKEVFEK
jgi:multiple sugar transport system substrate-binding protein/raffinose/stachyose/melibiose transport system substrate-binding protein